MPGFHFPFIWGVRLWALFGCSTDAWLPFPLHMGGWSLGPFWLYHRCLASISPSYGGSVFGPFLVVAQMPGFHFPFIWGVRLWALFGCSTDAWLPFPLHMGGWSLGPFWLYHRCLASISPSYGGLVFGPFLVVAQMPGFHFPFIWGVGLWALFGCITDAWLPIGGVRLWALFGCITDAWLPFPLHMGGWSLGPFWL